MISLIRILSLCVSALLFTIGFSHACTCIYIGTFEKYSEGQTVVRGKIARLGEKLRHGETLHANMKVSIIEVIKGSYAHEAVQLRGDPGNLCLTYVDADLYTAGSEHLFVLFGQEENQDLQGCGEASVSIVDDEVHGSGYVDDEWTTYTVNYDEFIETVAE